MLLVDGSGVKGSDADLARLEESLRQQLKTSVLECVGEAKGGLMCEGRSYRTDAGIVFVKVNWEHQARVMFEGERASLDAIHKTHTVKCPKAIKVFDVPGGGAALVEEHVQMRGPLKEHWTELGKQLAKLHLHNRKHNLPEKRFGFSIPNCFGLIEQDNSWEDTWLDFFCKRKMEPQIQLLEQQFADSQVRPLWVDLLPSIPLLFKDIEVQPSLIHGDMWLENIADTTEGPVVYDPVSIYGHDEYDLAFTALEDFPDQFYQAYHRENPLLTGWQGRRLLYQLLYYICHWNHFGHKYEQKTMDIFQKLKIIISEISNI